MDRGENGLMIGIGDSKRCIQFTQRFFNGIFDGCDDQFSSCQNEVPRRNGEGKGGNENR